MKNSTCILVILSLLLTSSIAEEYVVISAKSMPNMTLSQLRAVYLKKIIFINDVKMIPLNLGAQDELRLKFEKKVLKMSFSRLKAYWTMQHYLGKRPPISMKSQESVKSFVNKVDGSIAYIDASNIDDSVKVLFRWRE